VAAAVVVVGTEPVVLAVLVVLVVAQLPQILVPQIRLLVAQTLVVAAEVPRVKPWFMVYQAEVVAREWLFYDI